MLNTFFGFRGLEFTATDYIDFFRVNIVGAYQQSSGYLIYSLFTQPQIVFPLRPPGSYELEIVRFEMYRGTQLYKLEPSTHTLEIQ